MLIHADQRGRGALPECGNNGGEREGERCVRAGQRRSLSRWLHPLLRGRFRRAVRWAAGTPGPGVVALEAATAAGPYRSIASMASCRAWAGPRSARSRLKTSTHCLRASSSVSATRWAVLAVAAAGHGDVRRRGAGGARRGRRGRSRRSRPGLRGRWWRRRARRTRWRTPPGSRDRARGREGSGWPSSPMPVTVQVWRFATPRSGSLRRVATRSPSPTRSPRAVTRDGSASAELPVAGSARRWSRIAALRLATCSRVSATTRSPAAPASARAAVRSLSLGWMTIDPRRWSASKTAAGVVAGAHAQGERGVVGVGEPVHLLQRHDRGRVGPREGVVQDAAASDRWELVPVADERDPRPGLVGDRQERAGGVLVQHPRLVDQQQVPWSQPGGRVWVWRRGAGPSARRRPSASRAGGSARRPSARRRRSPRRRPRPPSTSASPPAADVPAVPARSAPTSTRWSCRHRPRPPRPPAGRHRPGRRRRRPGWGRPASALARAAGPVWRASRRGGRGGR